MPVSDVLASVELGERHFSESLNGRLNGNLEGPSLALALPIKAKDPPTNKHGIDSSWQSRLSNARPGAAFGGYWRLV